jgi:hypothetical protein
MTPKFRQATTLGADLEWATKHLFDGWEVWCVRWKRSGLVRTFIAAPPDWLAAQTGLDDEPLESFTVQRLLLSPETGRAMFGPECAWPS